MPPALRGVASRFGIDVPCERIHFRVRAQELSVVCNWSKGKHGLSVQGFDLTKKTKPRPRILLRREVARDAEGKAMGLNREVQTGDPTFDGHVYVESDASDRAVLETLSSEGVRHGVVELLARGANQVEIGPTVVTAKFSRPIAGDAEFEPDAILSTLDAFARVLETMPVATLERPSADAQPSGCVVILVAILVPIAAIVAYILSWSLRDWIGIVGYLPYVLGASAGAVLAVLGTVVSYVMLRLRPSSTGFRAFIARAVWCFFVFLPSGTPALFVADRLSGLGAPVQVVETHVVDVTSSEGEYLIEVGSWSRPGQTEIFEVDGYRGLSTGSRVRLSLQRGGLGFWWLRELVRLD